MYEGSRHDEIAELIRGCEPLPQRHRPRLSLDGQPFGRGGSEPPASVEEGAGRTTPRPRPNLYRRSA